MAKKVRVRMRGSTTVRYDQTVEMTREEWRRLKAIPPKQIGEGWLDLANIDDADEVDDFEAEVVDGDGEPVRPLDRYPTH